MSATSEASYRPIVKVGATATAMVEPDTAVISIRFGRRCKSQEACAKDYAAELAKAHAVLDGFGLADELKTSGYHAYARRTAKRGVIDGYEYGSWGTLKVERSQHDVSAIWQAHADMRLSTVPDVGKTSSRRRCGSGRARPAFGQAGWAVFAT